MSEDRRVPLSRIKPKHPSQLPTKDQVSEKAKRDKKKSRIDRWREAKRAGLDDIELKDIG